LPDDFPKTAAEWERVIAAAPGEDRPLTPEEEASMRHAVVVYGGGLLAVREALAKRRRGLADPDCAGPGRACAVNNTIL